MLRKVLSAGVVAIAVLVAAPARAASADARVAVDIGVFRQELAPYGEWISVGRYGPCWRPRHVVRTWRPYTVGYWVYTDYGWTWVSDEPWGWATDHYGRWFYDPHDGWVWVPGTEWAPAYVTWRFSDEWIGWAPLPPGVEPGVYAHVDVGPFAYSFVQTRYFLERRLGGHFAPARRNAVLVRSTRDATRFEVRGNRIIDRGVDPRRIRAGVGTPGARVASARLRGREARPRRRPRGFGVSAVGSPRSQSASSPASGRTSVGTAGGIETHVERRQAPTVQPRRARPRSSPRRQEAQPEQARGSRPQTPGGGAGRGGRGAKAHTRAAAAADRAWTNADGSECVGGL